MHCAVGLAYLVSSRPMKNPVLNIQIDTALGTAAEVEPFFPCAYANMHVCTHECEHIKYHIAHSKEEPGTSIPCISLCAFSSTVNSVCSVHYTGYMFFLRLNSHRIPLRMESAESEL